MKHRIVIKLAKRGIAGRPFSTMIRKSVAAALEFEGVDVPCEVSVLITDDEGIRAVNREFRNVDRPTDVLSFPMQELMPGSFNPDVTEADPETGFLPLGDMVVSASRVRAQADKYGHSEMRELSYLTIHSVLHLLGYDHMDEGEQKKRMRLREKAIVNKIGFNRGEPDD